MLNHNEYLNLNTFFSFYDINHKNPLDFRLNFVIFTCDFKRKSIEFLQFKTFLQFPFKNTQNDEKITIF